MPVEGQLAVFLGVAGGNASDRRASERFQRSGDTISRASNNALNAAVELVGNTVEIWSVWSEHGVDWTLLWAV